MLTLTTTAHLRSQEDQIAWLREQYDREHERADTAIRALLELKSPGTLPVGRPMPMPPRVEARSPLTDEQWDELRMAGSVEP